MEGGTDAVQDQGDSNFEKEEYKQAVDQMIQYIREGDIYIANMTQRLEVESEKAPLDVFVALRKNNPSPLAAIWIVERIRSSVHHQNVFYRCGKKGTDQAY